MPIAVLQNGEIHPLEPLPTNWQEGQRLRVESLDDEEVTPEQIDIGVQVKSLSKRDPVPLGTGLEKIMGNFWIIVNNLAKEPTAFILLPSEVKQRTHRGEKEGRISFWLQPKDYDQDTFREAWDRIGHGHLETAPTQE